jgi:release factor glutamine methyltransferase
LNLKIKSVSLGEWLAAAREKLAKKSSEHISSVFAIAENNLNKPATWLLTHLDSDLTVEIIHTLEEDLADLLAGKPLPYITGKAYFYGLQFKVDQSVLIPRPETECLVDTALEIIEQHKSNVLLADIGTGSGCIALSLAKNTEKATIIASDRSFPALEVAKENALRLGLTDRMKFIAADLLFGITARFDIICANLPYIPQKTLKKLRVRKWEPLPALNGGDSGLIYINKLIRHCEQWTKPDGRIILEIESSQGDAIRKLVEQNLPGTDCDVRKDLSGNDRIAVITL